MMRPKRPKTELKISITRILTNLVAETSAFATWHTTSHTQYSQTRIRCIRQRRTAPIDAHGHSAYQVAHAHRQATPEERIARIVVAARVHVVTRDQVEFCGEDDGHDDAVDGDDFAEDDGDEVLGPYSWGFDAAAQDGGAGYEDAPAMS